MIQRRSQPPPETEWTDFEPTFQERLAAMRPAWMSEAACKGQTDLFFPTVGGDVQEAKEICRSCPVRADCLGHAMSASGWGLHGVWGGVSQKKRLRMHRGAVA